MIDLAPQCRKFLPSTQQFRVLVLQFISTRIPDVLRTDLIAHEVGWGSGHMHQPQLDFTIRRNKADMVQYEIVGI